MPVPTFIRSPYFLHGRYGHQPIGIVIHVTENNTLDGLDRYFINNPRKVSAHYGIGKDGTIHQYVEERNVAWHASLGQNPKWRLIKPGVSPSYYTIGIEHVGWGHLPWQEAQYRASAALIKEICTRWDIPLDRDHIVPHNEVSDTACPGKEANIEKLINLAQGLSSPKLDFVKSSGSVLTKMSLNLRKGPTTSANVVRVIHPNTKMGFIGWITNGLSVDRNSYWYKDEGGNYFWAGGTEQPNPDLTPKSVPSTYGKTTHPLHLRKGPATNFLSVTVLPVGTPLQILEKQGDWLKIVTESDQGFVHSGFVLLEDESSIQTIQIGRTIAPLNLRTGPGTQFSILRVLPENTPITILAEEGKWLQVDFEGQEGHVHKDFVDFGTGRQIQPGFITNTTTTVSGVQIQNIPLKPHPSEQINSDHAVAKAWNRLGGLITVLAEILDIEPCVALAVWMVESGGKGFVGERMTIRFENHIFFNEWGQYNPALFNQHFKYNQYKAWQGHHWRQSITHPWGLVHTGSQAEEWRAFEFAATLHENAAKRSISMGGPQIMGFNHSRIGYETVLDMFSDFSKGERYQVHGFFNFIKGPNANSNMVRALRAQDFDRFSQIYNGGLALTHAQRMHAYYNKCRELR